MDHGTSHFGIVDSERNAVSMTTTVNYPFGAGVLSPSTGIVLNNEMGDFSSPTEISPDHLPPAPANFIEPNKRPLSSMTPLIIIKVKANMVVYEFSIPSHQHSSIQIAQEVEKCSRFSPFLRKAYLFFSLCQRNSAG